MGPLASNVVARAEVTRSLAHGDRHLATRVFLRDGRVLEQVNAGVPDLEGEWREIGPYADLDGALADLRRAGWSARRMRAVSTSWVRLVALLALVAVIAAVALTAAGPLILVGLAPVAIGLVLSLGISRWRSREHG